jgi:hypothetical protein
MNSKVILKKDDVLKLWLQGRDAWNQWVKDNPEADIDFSKVDFSKLRNHPNISPNDWPFAKFYFPKGSINFSNTLFGKGN